MYIIYVICVIYTTILMFSMTWMVSEFWLEIFWLSVILDFPTVPCHLSIICLIGAQLPGNHLVV